MTEKLLLINQLATDVCGLDDTNQEKEVGLILNKIYKLKEMEEQEIKKAEGDEARAEEITEKEFIEALS